MRYFLVDFRYEYYCQGYEWTRGQVLVEASTFESACDKIRQSTDYMSACDFVNKTLQEII